MFFDVSSSHRLRLMTLSRLRGFCFSWLLCYGLLVAAPAPHTHAQNANGAGNTNIASNATPEELSEISALVAQLDGAIARKDANTLLFFGLGQEAAQEPALRLDSRITNLAVSPSGALVRQLYRVSSSQNPGAKLLAQGTHEFFLSRSAEGSFAFTTRHWLTPDDAIPALVQAAREEWERPSAGKSTPPVNSLLHLVASRRGGRWIALRRSRWDGAIYDARALQNQARGQTIPPGYTLDPEWLRNQMNRQPAGAGIGHFVLQRGQNGWIGLGSAWDAEEKLSAEADNAATEARRAILTASYTSPTAHQAYGIALAQVGLYGEAADSLEKAEALQPGLVSANLLKQVTASRSNDPARLAERQLNNEAQVGLDPNHPSFLVRALVPDYNAQPSVLRALRLGLEYSRLGDDARAHTWLSAAQELVQRGALREATPSDQAWIDVLAEHLQERKQLAPTKPPVIIRSPLFVLRCWPNDLSAVQILASLEASQHTVYADFNIPMSCTEVLLWRNQAEFRSYTTRFSDQGQSEFVAALTLTKLIGTREGPVVLGEEVNVFTDARTAVFHTVAHEYGHVAVRQLSRGRNVPTWFNEGIATSVEGGYDGYLERVRAARTARALISMDEMLEWNVDGERAFLAYSQANSIIDYIVATWGKEAVMNILRQIGGDTNAEDAFRRTLGISQQELWRRWARDGVK